ncbi:MAG: RluA family pseudouridine synthase [Deltaproteobacteria bacterium]|nr:RluA family pseudouridine synthase [Deltaproteobacteria bacterium]
MKEHSLVADRSGERLDVFVCQRLPSLNRSQIKRLIDQGLVYLDGEPAKAGARLKAGQEIKVSLPPPQPAGLEPEPLDLEIVYEDEDLIVINKPPGLVVHPAPGHPTGTLVHGLLHHCPGIAGVGGKSRPGIVHRLDKDTSGLIVAAKHDQAHQALSEAFAGRRVAKAYLTILLGRPRWQAQEVCSLIGRHPQRRKKMAVVDGGREAISRFKVKRELAGPLTLMEVELQTGRTHQIRVQAAHLGHPVLGDPLYGSRSREKSLTRPVREAASRIERQMLHAWRLAFEHPMSGRSLQFEATLPQDFQCIVDNLSYIATC